MIRYPLPTSPYHVTTPELHAYDQNDIYYLHYSPIQEELEFHPVSPDQIQYDIYGNQLNFETNFEEDEDIEDEALIIQSKLNAINLNKENIDPISQVLITPLKPLQRYRYSSSVYQSLSSTNTTSSALSSNKQQPIQQSYITPIQQLSAFHSINIENNYENNETIPIEYQQRINRSPLTDITPVQQGPSANKRNYNDSLIESIFDYREYSNQSKNLQKNLRI